MSLPLYGFVEGDTLGLVVIAEEDETLSQLARRLQDAARVRVALDGDVQFVCNGQTLDPNHTVRQAGLQALDRFDVRGRTGA